MGDINILPILYFNGESRIIGVVGSLIKQCLQHAVTAGFVARAEVHLKVGKALLPYEEAHPGVLVSDLALFAEHFNNPTNR